MGSQLCNESGVLDTTLWERNAISECPETALGNFQCVAHARRAGTPPRGAVHVTPPAD